MVSPATSTCPKCGAPRQEPACPRCGLRADKMEAFARSREEAVPEVVRAAWEKVVASWDDTALHDALFTLTTTHGVYAWTAARYRESGKTAGASDAHLERVRKVAEMTLLASATASRARKKTPYASSMMVIAVVVLMILVGLALAMFMKMKSEQLPQPVGAPARTTPARPTPAPPAAPSQVR